MENENNEGIESDWEKEHHHCLNCFESTCWSLGCPMIMCPKCGVDMHDCKLEDHLDCICPRVSCIN